MCNYTEIDWPLLGEQKRDLIEQIENLNHGSRESESIAKIQNSLIGILHLIDYIQDEAFQDGIPNVYEEV